MKALIERLRKEGLIRNFHITEEYQDIGIDYEFIGCAGTAVYRMRSQSLDIEMPFRGEHQYFNNFVLVPKIEWDKFVAGLE